jgi:hypothetical protein
MARRLLRKLRDLLRAADAAAPSWSSAMLLALGAASSAIDALKALTSSKPPSPANQDAANLFAFSADASASAGSTSGSGSGGGASISPQTMSALLAAQSQSGSAPAPMSRSDALKDLFSQIDADGDGKITKSEFENALGAGGTNLAQADDVFSKLDKDGDGSVSLGETASALKSGKGHHRHHHVASGSGDGTETDSPMQALQGATSTSTTNADGSVTTSLTYADGSKVTMTSASASGAAASSYNFIEQMIGREARAISAQTSSSLSVSV